jgi:transposase
MGTAAEFVADVVDDQLETARLADDPRQFDPDALIADKAFDADPFIAALNDRAIVPVIPSKSNRKTPRPCDFVLYCERNLIKRFFKNQGDRTRYDKLDKIFLAGVQLTCSALLSTEDRPLDDPRFDSGCSAHSPF